MSKRKGIER